jgi:prepilin-type N-terminal cleavage/methylation domain-containing protein
MQSHVHNKGLTLIEVLVAIVILSTGIVLLLQVFNTTLFAAREATESSIAQMLLREKVSEVQLYMNENRQLSQLPRSGSFPLPFDKFEWRLVIQPVQTIETMNVENSLEIWEWLKVIITVERINGGRPYTTSFFVREKRENEKIQ